MASKSAVEAGSQDPREVGMRLMGRGPEHLDNKILFGLLGRPQRYSAFRPLIGQKRDNNLTVVLKRLQSEGLIMKLVDPEDESHTEYQITTLGILGFLEMHRIGFSEDHLKAFLSAVENLAAKESSILIGNPRGIEISFPTPSIVSQPPTSPAQEASLPSSLLEGLLDQWGCIWCEATVDLKHHGMQVLSEGRAGQNPGYDEIRAFMACPSCSASWTRHIRKTKALPRSRKAIAVAPRVRTLAR